MFQRGLFAAFLAILFGNGLYKYLFKGIYQEHSQWDFISHLNGFLWTMAGTPPQIADAPVLYFPPYLPAAFPIFDLFSMMNQEVARLLWLLILCAGMCFVVLQMLSAMFPKGEDDNNLPGKAFPLQNGMLPVLIFWLFPGTFLGLAAGQMSLFVIFCLVFFWVYRNQLPLTAAALLGLATIKISLALPFFLFLLLRYRYRQLGWAIGFSIFFNGIASFFYLGPAGHFHHIRQAAANLETFGVNSALLMAASGRIDLAPFAAIFGIGGMSWYLLAAGIFGGGMLWLFRHRTRLGDDHLVLYLNLLIFVLLYHRSYDLVIILFFALPMLWQRWQHFSPAHLMSLLPFALPLQSIFHIGQQASPNLALFWHFLGCSTVIGMWGIWWLTSRKWA